MVSILKASGFQCLESLKDFSDRFPHLPYFLDKDLQKIWICHRNSENIPKVEDIRFPPSKTCHTLFRKIQRRIATEEPFDSLLTEFSALSIFEKLYSHFDCLLTTYLVTQCYIFYNWGINAFEPVFRHFEIYKMILESQKNRLKSNRRKTKNDCRNLKDVNVSNEVGIINQETGDLFESERKCKSSKSVRFEVSLLLKSLKQKRFYEFTKNPRNPYQEIFTLNKILYDMKQRSQWFKNSILNTKDVEDLILFIIRLPVTTSNFIENKLLMNHQNWKNLRLLLKSFIKNHEILNKTNGFGRILKSHLKNVKTASDWRLNPIPKSVVCSYISHILREALPLNLFGTLSIRKHFFAEFVKVIKGNKKETFIWYPLLKLLLERKNNVPWIAEIGNYYIQSLVVLKVFKFIIVHYAFNVIRSNFYVTETGSSGFGLRYYLKGDMESASTIYLKNLLRSGHIKHVVKNREAPTLEREWLNSGVITEKGLRSLKIKMSPKSQYQQSVALVRFLPKNDDSDALRIITYIPKNVSKSGCVRSASKRLEKFFKKRKSQRKKSIFFAKHFLEFLVDRRGFGIGPLPSDLRLEMAWKRAVCLIEKHGEVFFVKADISEAFNSVKYSILYEVLRLAVEKESEKGTLKLKKIIEWKNMRGRIRKVVRFSFSNHAKENSVMIQRSCLPNFNKITNKNFGLKFLQIIKQIVMNQEIIINGTVFRMKRGLAQGSAGLFSSQLCELYYSSMDRLFFGEFINSSDSVLLRAVDDYLFISSDLKKAEKFLKIVQHGIKEYNVLFNQHKLKSNLIENIQDVTYLGLIFNFKSMTVEPDYSRYYKGGFLSSMNLSDKGGCNHFNKELFLRKRLLDLRCLKLNSIVINGIHNNLQMLRQTIFNACRVQSLRVMALANYLYFHKLKDDFAVYLILSLSCGKIRNLVGSIKMSSDEFNWIFFFAASLTLERYSGQFKTLLKLIRFRLQRCENDLARNGTPDLSTFLKDFLKSGTKKW